MFQSTKETDLWSKPLLLYYGMMSFLKALTLTHFAHYPQNTLVLQHGLSTRKKKKKASAFYKMRFVSSEMGFSHC